MIQNPWAILCCCTSGSIRGARKEFHKLNAEHPIVAKISGPKVDVASPNCVTAGDFTAHLYCPSEGLTFWVESISKTIFPIPHEVRRSLRPSGPLKVLKSYTAPKFYAFYKMLGQENTPLDCKCEMLQEGHILQTSQFIKVEAFTGRLLC